MDRGKSTDNYKLSIKPGQDHYPCKQPLNCQDMVYLERLEMTHSGHSYLSTAGSKTAFQLQPYCRFFPVCLLA